MPIYPGYNPNAGRKKGVPNKINGDIRDMIIGALQDVGGRKYLAQRAIDTPGPFLALVGKILPTQIAGGDGTNISLHLIAAQLVSAELSALTTDAATVRTIDAEPVEQASLLDAPPPTE